MRLFFTFLLCSKFLNSQVWIQLSDYPALKRDDGVAVVVNNKAYFGTGLIEFAATIDFHALDLSTYTWSDIPNLPNTKERQYACAFAGVNCFYVFGGDGDGGALNNMYRYDIASGTWTNVTSKPGNGLIGASCMSFGDKIIISGGKFQSGRVSAEVWEYTISSDAWLQKNDYPFAGRWRASATVYNSEGYLLFGRDTAGAYRKELYKYQPAIDSWTKVSDFPMAQGRAYSSLNVYQDRLVVFGGHDTLNHFYKDLWYFNATTSNWLQGPDIPGMGRRGGMSCSAGNKLFYSCGLGETTRLTETWMTDVPVGLKELATTAVFFLYPNPTNGLLQVNSSSFSKENISCSYSDISGRELGSVEEISNGGAIDLQHLGSGVYFLKFYSDKKELIEVKKIVIN